MRSLMPAPTRSCRDAALSYLGRRAHTRRELTQKLGRKGYDAQEIERVLSDLARLGYVDDARTAQALVRSRTAGGRGRRAIASDLAARGVTGETAAGALAGLHPEDEEDALRAALAKKNRSLPARLTGRERSKKLFDHLVRRGFAPGAVLEALRTKGDKADDDE
jgi:regulatory protein